MADDFPRLEELIVKYNPNANLKLIEKAYNFSKKAHEGQERVSGDPYITHPVEVGCILAELEMDDSSIAAGILHDTIEDTALDYDMIKSEFGEEIAELVDGVTKLTKIPYTTKQEIQAESFRKMFLAMAKDIRVIIIKLCDRLHNMRTLKFMPRDKQLKIARETMEIYAPLAHRLGINRIKWELEDLSFRYLDEKNYYDLAEKIAKKRREREAYINSIIEEVRQKTEEFGIKADIEGRAKHLYSIYKKMTTQNKTLEQIYDLFAIRLIVDTVKDCYAVLGIMHELFKPMPGRFKDYISLPKPNMYQSLHSTVIGPEGIPFEIQIRTWEMHRVAEVGIAAHWRYKDGTTGEKSEKSYAEKLSWLRQMLEWQKDARDPDEFMENLKIDLFTDEVFVFTPKGDVKSLKAGSTPIDFAYSIHSAIGNRMIGAKVNGRIVTLDYELKNGDIVEIITSGTSNGPSRDWLKLAKTSQARNKINQWFKKEKREENVERGKEIFEKELKKNNLTVGQLLKSEYLEVIYRKYNFHNIDDIYAAIALGAMTANKIVIRLREEYRKSLPHDEQTNMLLDQIEKEGKKKKKEMPDSGVVVKGIDNCLVRLSRCCNPVPGDEIIGYITRGRGVSIHRKDCPNVKNNIIDGDARLIDVYWYKNVSKTVSYLAEVALKAHDRPGLIVEITNAIGESRIPLRAINARTAKDSSVSMHMTLEINNAEQLDRIIAKMGRIKDVFDVSRSK